jgi:hypothetical protein
VRWERAAGDGDGDGRTRAAGRGPHPVELAPLAQRSPPRASWAPVRLRWRRLRGMACAGVRGAASAHESLARAREGGSAAVAPAREARAV